jgi:hypothetical protein
MIELIDIQSPIVVGMKIKGKISKDGIGQVLALVKEKMENTDERLHIYVELEAWSGISLAAFVEDVKFAIPNLRKFAKKAVVTDKSWVATLGEIGDKFFPSIEFKTFTFEEKKDALRWITE